MWENMGLAHKKYVFFNLLINENIDWLNQITQIYIQ